MPEMPEVEGLRHFLSAQLVGRSVARVELAAFSALKTYATPLTALLGGEIDRVDRRGKFLCIGVDGLWLACHLARAGWLRWYDAAPEKPARPGKGPLAFRFVAEGPPTDPALDGLGPVGFDLTEAGTQKHLALFVVSDLVEVPGIARLGPDPLAEVFTLADFTEVLLAHPRTQVKGLLKDQRVFAGIGNAYSDEILQAARLSPFKLAGSLDDHEYATLFDATRATLTAAIGRAVGLPPGQLKDNKRSHLGIHGHQGEPCPTCGTPIAEVSFADSFLNYCPGCQTGGKLLADRRMSRLLK